MGYKTICTLDELKVYLSGVSIVAFDFETAPDEKYRRDIRAALDAHKSRIVGISFAVGEGDAAYLPLTHTVGENATDPAAIWDWLKAEFFENPAIIKVAHNLAFEAAFLYVRGIIVQEPCYDTIAAAQLIYKNEKEFRGLADSGLKVLVSEYFKTDLPSYADTVGGLHFDELDPAADRTVNYACADADYTLRIYHLLNNWFDRFLPKHRFIVEKVESPTAVYVGLMRYNGLPIDRQLMEEKGADAARRITELKQEIAFIIGDIPIGANASTAAFKKYLYDDLGLPVFKTTEKYQAGKTGLPKRPSGADVLGKRRSPETSAPLPRSLGQNKQSEGASTNDEALILLKEHCEKERPELVRLFELIQELRRWGKIKGTYIDGYLKHINAATGRIHPDLLPLATTTGRFASKNPNCQNMPRARRNSPSAFVSGQESPEKLTAQAVAPLSHNVHSVGTLREPYLDDNTNLCGIVHGVVDQLDTTTLGKVVYIVGKYYKHRHKRGTETQ